MPETAPLRERGAPSAAATDPATSGSMWIAVLAGAALFAAAAVVPRLTGTDVHAGWTGWPPLA
ncbi:MAG: hypothetical protein H0V23_02615, partial [Nocardioidaceae bacterium]|nr:hypothetical protein [Nocardioidaceae bacterium]